MSSGCCKVLLCLFAVTWMLLLQSTNGTRNDRRCRDLLRRLLRSPPNNTKIAINIGLSKARYTCHEGFKLVGKEVRTCKGGKWIENVETKCLEPCGKPEDIPHSKVVGSSFNFNDQLRYECIKGYTLTGPKLRTCGNDGKWSEAPRCEKIIQCGQSLVTPRARIVGGTISQRGMWPWQIAIYRINRNVPQFSCGGALVSRRWVLTAAHCFYARFRFIGNANLYLIKAGDHNLSVNESLQQETVPEEIFVHPRFKPIGLPFFDGDIALIKLKQEVKLSKFVRTVCLPEKSEGDLAIPKTRGTVAGWGVTRSLRRGEFTHLSEISKVLRHASFPIQSDQLCTNKSGIQFNTTTAFCAGDGRGGEDACQGDSGGAFVRDASFGLLDSKWVVIGLVSWGNGCAQKDQYGYYTRIHPFLDWIKETMNEEKQPANNKPTNQCSSETSRIQKRRGINLNEDCGLDLVFLFDASVSVDKFYFQTSLAFARELLTIIGASKRSSRTQVAAVTEAKLEFNLGDSKADTIDKAIKAIGNIMYVGWISSYIRPFKLVRNKVAPNSRNDSHQVLMFITDGLDLSGSARREAKYLRDNKHFEVYAIGIGRKVKTRALMSIASANEDHNHVITVRKYRNLQEAVQRVVHMDIDLASCQSPGGITHGKKFGSDYSHNKTVTYICHAEYTLEGKNKLTCNDGKWNYNPPQCKAPCSKPGSPANGTMRANNFRHNSWVTFSCDRHHQRDGKERIKCIDGSWSGSVPVCIAMCPDPGVPSQGMRVGDNFQDGKTVTFECKKNYDLLGNSTIRCNGGVWNSETPKCKGRCDYSGTPNNGYTTNGNFRRGELLSHGSKVEYACGFSYTLTGSKILHCDDGTWNGSLPSCKASCNDPGSIAQARKIGNDYSHGQIVTYECVTQGYSLVGNPTLTCNDGSWDSQLPQCKVRSQCGADLTTESGVITSPRFPSSYPDEANCEWKIAVDNGSRITLTFVMFEVEGGNKCKYDYLEVSNGETRDSANQVAKLCGTELPKPITSSGPHLFLKFRSDSSMAFKGFKLRFTKTALNNCGATISTLSGEIKSPNYPQPYQPNRNCIWKIRVPSGNHIQLAFKEINIEEGETGKCVYDYVQVYSGIGQEAESLGRYCGKQSVKLATSAHTMTITFHSDNTINSKGFKAMFAAAAAPAIRGAVKPELSRGNSAIKAFSFAANRNKEVCGAHLQASNTKRQFISHPSYGDDNYEPNLHCKWQLTARSGYKIHLRLKEFDVEVEKNCGYDYVIIRDGNNSTAPLLGRVCGKGRPVEFVTGGNRMWIEFRTDLTTNKKGFIAEYWTSLKTDK